MGDALSLLLSFSKSHPVAVGSLFICFSVVLISYVLLPKSSSKTKKKKQHALITGGSSGIGLGLANECLKQGVEQVTLIARNMDKLNKAKQELLSTFPNAMIHIVSLDVTDSKKVESELDQLVKQHGPPTLLFNNAGTSIPNTFVDAPISDFENLMKLNYLGAVYVTKALVPAMIQASSGGSIVFVSSMAGQCGIFGLSAYSPTKAALISLSQCLQSELHPHDISVTVAYPPDTETPGFQLELEGKPLETKLLSETAGLFSADVVAKSIVKAALSKNPPFAVYFGLEGWMLSTLTAGMSPVSSLVNATCQVFLMGILRFVSLFYLKDFERIIRKCHNDKLQEQNNNKSKKE